MAQTQNAESFAQKIFVDEIMKNLNDRVNEICSQIVGDYKIPHIRDGEWKDILVQLQLLESEAVTEEANSKMRRAMDDWIREICGKQKSKQTVHNILVKATKIQKLSIHAKAVFDLLHPHFCTSLEDFVEIEIVQKGQPNLLYSSMSASREKIKNEFVSL
jgi:hypothetical protein